MSDLVNIISYPSDEDWMLCKRLALKTVSKTSNTPPTPAWKEKILLSEHSPIRCLHFTIEMTIPYWVSVHFVRHKFGVEHFVASQRNDRQTKYDRNSAPQNEIVSHTMYLNAQALINISHKRLCNQASKETREVMRAIVDKVVELCPEFRGVLVPSCVYRGGICTEFYPCGKHGKD